MATKKDTANVNFEDELNKLEAIINDMESGQLKLEDNLEKYEQGIKLVTNCQSMLQKAQQKVQILTKKSEKLGLTEFEKRL